MIYEEDFQRAIRERIQKEHAMTRKRKKKSDKVPRLNQPQRDRIKTRDGHKCVECGSTDDLHVHHIKPRSKGGTNDDWNLVTLCSGCHEKKHEGECVERLMKSRKGK